MLALKFGFSGAVLVIPARGCCIENGVIGAKREMCQSPLGYGVYISGIKPIALAQAPEL